MKDELDYKIIKLLEKDSRASFVEIAKKLLVTEGTVRQRVKRMQKQGEVSFTIRHKATEGLVMIKAKNLRHIVDELRTYTDNIYELSGEYDIAAIIDAQSIQDLNKKIDRIRTIKGIIKTNTAISLTKR